MKMRLMLYGPGGYEELILPAYCGGVEQSSKPHQGYYSVKEIDSVKTFDGESITVYATPHEDDPNCPKPEVLKEPVRGLVRDIIQELAPAEPELLQEPAPASRFEGTETEVVRPLDVPLF